MKVIVSPITHKPARRVLHIDREKVKEKYRQELNMDVGRFLDEKEISIYTCEQTGYRFYYPFNILGDSIFYAELQKKGSYYSEWKWENEVSLEFIGGNDSLLDIGCGDGSYLRVLRKKGFTRLQGIDSSADTLRIEPITGVDISSKAIGELKRETTKKFDVITCFQVLEHISDVRNFIHDCVSCLKPGGKLIVAVPLSNPFIFKHDLYHTLNLPPHHAGLWNEGSLRKLAPHFGLKLLSIRFQPLGNDLLYYLHVQIGYLSQRFPLLRGFFQSSMFVAVYRLYLSSLKSNLKGHTILAVYSKN